MTFSEKKSLNCRNCGSIISISGYASMWLPFAGASTSGYLVAKLLGFFLSIKVALISICVAFIVFAVLSYFTAPIRRA